jgi:predicted dehydrogenase
MKTSVAALAGATLPWVSGNAAPVFAFDSPMKRPLVGCIGVGDRWYGGIASEVQKYGNVVAVCDVDANHLSRGRERIGEIQEKKGYPKSTDIAMHEDYRKILDRKDIEVVTIVTPDHWHSKIAIEAMKAGKDVYCEKPLTLTVDEGKQIIKVLKETKRVFQVGTQQRSEMGLRFLQAVALVRSGRIGKLKKVTCVIGGAPEGSVLPTVEVPKGLDWEKWLGQAPLVDYVSGPKPAKGYAQSRCHYEFRWWYEYSGGKMTDWGAHHVDIAQWAMGMDHEGPLTIEGVADHPVPFKDGVPTIGNRFNAATRFLIRCTFPSEMQLYISSDGENGITFEGTEGRFFVSRNKMTGRPVDELKTNPISEDVMTKLYKGKKPGDHMRNFFECLVTREDPISDVYTHHRAMTTCHLANIAIRLDRKLNWDAKKEEIVGDKAANQWLTREQRKGYEVQS